MSASIKQIEFITRLVSERYDASEADGIIAGIPFDALTAGKAGTASALISKLLAMPKQQAPGTPQVVADAARSGVNSSTGTCHSCGHPVAASAGFYYGPFDGEKSRWRTAHQEGACSTEPVPEPVTVEAGYWHVGTNVYSVYLTKNQRLAAKLLDTDTLAWNYERGAISVIAAGGTKLTAEQLAGIAKRFGVAHDKCMFCSLPLSDPRSNPALGGAGYGPTCAEKHGLPWG